MNAPAPGPAAASAAAASTAPSTARRHGLAALTLGALGVVYGDIGTSPLYTLREVFAPATGVPLDAPSLIGAVSLIVWALMLVVTLKYVLLILRADNHGEGGGLALTALAAQAVADRPRLKAGLILLGVAGATLFYGDSVITPAISVLGAMEGLQVLTPALKPYVVPLSVAILLGLFLVQRFGTAVVGRWFGPVIALWFATLALTGVLQIVQQPAILAALDPRHALAFVIDRGPHLLLAIGAVVLALTGAEALYADLGHFGRRPIQLAWCGLVLPALALNYMGQGALLMRDPSALDNPFFRLFPDAWLIPALLLTTMAAIIASQAVISGAYSMTRQAMQLGFLPRLSVRHTSAQEMGQIYMPGVNTLLLVGVIGAVLAFGSSSALAGAYGIAVTLTMLITTVLTWFVVRRAWRVPTPLAVGATALFLAVDVLLVAGCVLKFFDGGWFPIALGVLLFVLMATWARGRTRLVESIRRDGLALDAFVADASLQTVHRASRTAVYLSADPATVPQALLHNLRHNEVLHRRNIILTVVAEPVPWVGEGGRMRLTDLGHGFWRMTLHWGFMQTPDVPRALPLASQQGLGLSVFECSFFLSREVVVPRAGAAGWRDHLFAAMGRNAGSAADYFGLPRHAVIELGSRVAI